MRYIELEDVKYRVGDRENSDHGTTNTPKASLQMETSSRLCTRDITRGLWERSIYVADEHPIQHYQSNYRYHVFDSAEEVLDDFYEYYEPRNWVCHAEWKEENGPVYIHCAECGWEGDVDDLDHVTVYEDWGDVDCTKCPACGAVECEGYDLFEEI